MPTLVSPVTHCKLHFASVMSYLKSLRRLLPARKAWSFFTRTLQTKLHNLNRSKAIKKHKKNKKKNHHHHHLSTIPCSKSTFWQSLSFKSRSKQKIKSGYLVNTLRYKPRHRVQKKNAPVYVDHLFIEPVLTRSQPLEPAKGKVKDRDQDGPAIAGTSKGDWKSRSADDMWESLVLASPQMHGINERAEEFISRFRAEMQVQERPDGPL